MSRAELVRRLREAVRSAKLPDGEPWHEYLDAFDQSNCEANGIIWPTYAYDRHADVRVDQIELFVQTIADAVAAALEGDAQPVADIDTLMEIAWTMARCSSPTDRQYWAGELRSALVATPPSPKLGVAVEALKAIAQEREIDAVGDKWLTRGARIAREALSQLEKPGEDRDV